MKYSKYIPFLIVVFLLGCIPKEAKNSLEIVLAASSGFYKNITATAAEKGGKAADGTIIPDGPTKIKNHIKTMNGLINNLDALASSAISAKATQDLVDNPASSATYDEHVSEAVSWIKEIHVLCANYVKNDLPTSSLADDEDLLDKLNSALTGLSNEILGETKTQAILNIIIPTTTVTKPTSAATSETTSAVTGTASAAQGALSSKPAASAATGKKEK